VYIETLDNSSVIKGKYGAEKGVKMSEIDVVKSELDALERAAIEPNLSLTDLLDIKKRIRRLRRKLNLILKKEVNK
jgi:hypothetical protein